MARSSKIIRGSRMAAYLGFLEAKASGEVAGKKPCGEVTAVDAALAHRRQRRSEVALGEAPPIVVRNERVVEIGRLGQAKQRLQEPLDGRGRAQVGAAH